ncbi:MAG: M28 family peptidase [Chloroflexota bacterium]|nr:M28 family peptidase [Chloroflexota bacterium]
MKCKLFFFPVGLGIAALILAAPVMGQQQPPPALVRIDLRGSDDLARVVALDLPVQARLTAPGADYLLAVSTSPNRDRLQSLDLAWTVLDPDAQEAVYYLIESGHPRMAERAASVFVILHDDGRQAVARLREGVPLSAVDDLGVPVARLGSDPIMLAPRTTGAIPTTPLYDPLVVALFSQITETTVSDYDGGLSGEHSVMVGGQPYTLTTRYSYSGESLTKATQYVYEHMQTLGYDVSYHGYELPDYDLRNHGYELPDYDLRNVIGEKQGLVHPDQIFLLTAHLDSRAAAWPHDPAPGADDNASGSTALLVAADLLADVDLVYTIRIVFFTGEEQGVWGSYYYARDVADAGEDILGVLNLDMIGWDAEGGPDIDLHSHLPGVEDDSDRLADLFAAVVDVYGLDLEPQIVKDGTRFSDHSRFWDQGYAAILAIEDYYNADESPAQPRDWNTNYHTANDRLSTLNLAYFREYARASLATFVHLAEPMRVLSGTVTDAGTATPLSATVVALGQDGTFADTTGVSGDYEIVLPPGLYTVTASAEGYCSQTWGHVPVLTGTVETLDLALEPAAPPPPYDFALLGQTLRFGKPMERVTHTVTIANTGVLSDSYDLALGLPVWTTTLPFTRSAVLSPQQQVTVPLAVTIPPGAAQGDDDRVTLTVTSVYSPVHAGHVVLRTAVGYTIHLPLVLKDLQTGEHCTEGVANGGFESDSDWELPITEYSAAYTTAAAHSGSRSMRLGIVEPDDDRYSYSSAHQAVTVPTGAISATLRFWLYPMSEEPPADLALPAQPWAPTNGAFPLASDTQYVLILDEQGYEIERLVSQRRNDRQWIYHQFDLTTYAGQTIRLHFGVYNDGQDGVTAMYVDDVSLEICFATPASP